jgi:hypothetical protein
VRLANRLLIAAAAAFCGIASLSVGFAAWTYATSVSSKDADVSAAVGSTWIYPVPGCFYGMNGNDVIWDPPLSVTDPFGSDGSGSINAVNVEDGTDTCAFFPISLDGKQITTLEGGVENSDYLKEIYIPDSYSTISSNAFMDSGLTEVHFYSASDYDPNVTAASSFTITGRAFLNCHDLTTVDLPANLTKINRAAFMDNQWWDPTLNLNYPNTISDWFNKVSLGSMWHLNRDVIVKCSDGDIHYGSGNEHSITYKDGVSVISANARKNDTDLTAVSFPSSLTSIGATAFYGTTSLTEITLPESLTSIGASAFATTSTTSLAITYLGTKAEWNAISKGNNWSKKRSLTIACSDGTI